MPSSTNTVRNDMSDNTPNTDPGAAPEQPQANARRSRVAGSYAAG